MADFIQAMKWMLEGKRITRKSNIEIPNVNCNINWNMKLASSKNIFLTYYNNEIDKLYPNQYINEEDITSIYWELFEEPKTPKITDKIIITIDGIKYKRMEDE